MKAERNKKAKSTLTPKQEAFAEHYLGNGFNGAQAARAAGYNGDDQTLRAIAYQNLQKPEIAAHVRARLDGLAANADEVLNLLGDHLRADLGDFAPCWTASGDFDLVKARTLGLSHLIKKLKRRRRPVMQNGKPTGLYGYEVEIELHDSQAAAGKLIPVLGLKQQPGENERDAERKRAAVAAQLARLVGDGWTPEEAKEIVLEADPTTIEYLN